MHRVSIAAVWGALAASVLATAAIAASRWGGYVGDSHVGLFGVVVTVLLSGAGLYLSYWIYNQQAGISVKQNEIQLQLMQRVFGSLTDFEQVYQEAVDLVAEANTKPNARLGVMCYWLWFGADKVLKDDQSRTVASIKALDSGIQMGLSYRITHGLETTVVTFDPAKERSAKALEDFVRAAAGWQLRAGGRGGANDVGESDVKALVKRYSDDLQHIEDGRSRSHGTKFRPVEKRESIPMLMFAAVDETTRWYRGLICLAEAEALQAMAKVGGFRTQDKDLVTVVMEQITQAR